MQIFYPLLYLGIIGAGGCFTGTNPGYTSYEMNHHVKTSGAKFIITEPHMLQTVLESAAASNIPDSHIYVFDAVDHHPYDGFKSWEYLLQHGESDWLRLEPDEVRTTVAQLLFTSGTTGLPKAAMLPHSYTVFQSWVLRTPPKKNYEVNSSTKLTTANGTNDRKGQAPPKSPTFPRICHTVPHFGHSTRWMSCFRDTAF